MQLALINDNLVEALSGARGLCPICGSEMIAKCGPRIINHWAHYRLKDCDLWWENETVWRRNWKNLFPITCREISHVAYDGEIHRADVKTPTGIVIELQHSSMTDAERISREEFYRNLIWVIDGSSFRQNFNIYHRLPDPNSEVAKDLIWLKAKTHNNSVKAGIFFRLSEAQQENPKITKAEVQLGSMHRMLEIQDQVDQSYSGYHQYDWVYPHKTWLDAQCPVYIDFGDDYLVKLEVYDESRLPCIRYVSKHKLVHDIIIKTYETLINQ